MKKYIKFGLMILTSTIVMYFLMFVNVSEFSHIHLSQTRIYMALLMGGVMAIIMLMMFDNVIEFSHCKITQTRIYIVLLMGGVMAMIMLLFMWKMYDNKKLDTIILGISVLIVGVSFGFIQKQVGVGDTAWMKA